MSKKKTPRKFNCLICGIECESRDIRSKICNSKKCILELNKLSYNEKKYHHNCKYCGISFEGTYRSVLCSKCKSEPKRIKFNKILRNVLCRNCNNKISNEYININRRTVLTDYHGDKLCVHCINKSRELASSRMKENKNPNWKGGIKIRKYNPVSDDKKEINYKKSSDRMTKCNPMFNSKTKEKVSKTIQEMWDLKRKNGTIIYGDKHHSWRGNRIRSQIIRSRLYPIWIFPILSRDGFSCKLCGKSKIRLEVHHLYKTFGEVLNEVKEKYNINLLSDVSNNIFEKISEEVIDIHRKTCQGITLCINCHKKIDPQRK